MPGLARAALPILVYLVAAACGPGKDTSSTDTASGTTTAGTTASTTASTTSTSDNATSQPTSTTGPAPGCDGVDEATCSASSPLNGENLCVWVDVYTATIDGTLCRTALARSTCMEANANEGGPGCSGFFKAEQNGAELLVGTGCGDPVSEPAWEFCFIDGVTPAKPECACIGESYCADQIDEVNCVTASHDLKTCAWQQPVCVPG
ncbi:MAG: hypothetical protein H0T76_21485 [Nannocystis sp.]|nr:hypothetical protein [Nannocystis sp.]MBA3549065.1 hypothetical protein [Nannocystis sp.]